MKKILSFLFQVSFVTCCSLITNSSAIAQPITTDGTLPTPTEVTPTDSGVEINGGTTRGGNLFHSFQDFSVPTNNEAFFNNANDLANILSRVTGGNISNIDGLIRANGEANLFLINPAGIIFGSNARLDLGGSFLGSTADGLLFDDGTEFSATNTQAEPILTINAPIGLNFRDHPQPITNRSTANDLGLQVDAGKNITLVGGELNFEGGRLTAPGGRIELGGLSTAGEVGISSDGNLTFADGIARADLTFTDGAFVDVRADGGGFININANNLNLRSGSSFLAGIAEGSTTPEAQAGDITVNATGAIALRESSSIQNRVNPDSIGNAGKIQLESGSLSIDSGARIFSVNLGQGNGGDIAIDTQDTLSITGVGRADSSDNSPPPSIASVVFSSNVGNAGKIEIEAGSFSLTNFTAIDSSNLSTAGGNAGDVTINARDEVLISESGINSVLFNKVGALGNAGNITVNANSIRIEQTSFVDSSNFDLGNSGDISFQANSISMQAPFIRSQIADGEAGDINIVAEDALQIDGAGATTSGITVESFDTGDGGSLNIKANSFDLQRGAILNAIANGEGNGGSINIDVNTMNVDRALINASSFGRGKGGNIQISATESLEIKGSGLAALQGNSIVPATQNSAFFQDFNANDVPNAGFQGILAATITQEGTAAGNINLDTANLNIKEGGLIATATTGVGTAGNITVNVSESLAVKESLITSSTLDTGQAGDIEFNTARFVVEAGGQIAASSLAAGDGGDLTINATEFVELRGTTQNGMIPSSLLVGSQLTSGMGNSGNLKITTSKLAISDGAEITASTLGMGTAGSIEINATNSVNLKNNASIAVNSLGGGNAGELKIFTNSLTLDRQSNLSAETVASQGGNIELEISNLLSLKDNSNISTSAGSESTKANGGNITIDADFVLAFPSGNSDITANAFQGQGGAIQISTEGIFGIAERELNPDSNDINASSDFGLDGSIAIEILNLKTFQETTAPPENIVESEQQVVAGICNPIQTAQNIEAGKQNNSTLTIRGRGRLPDEPTQSLVSDNISLDNQITFANKKSEARKEEVLSPIITAQGKIYPARGIARDRDGNLILTAYSPNHKQRNSDNLSCYSQ